MSSFMKPFKVDSLSSNTQDVEIAPSTGISVLIVGAGVGGLVAALECTRKGHHVRLFEREATVSSAGDMFTIALSGRRWFAHWPEMAKELDKISMHNMSMEYHKHSDETVIPAIEFKNMIKNAPKSKAGPPMVPQLRPLFHQMLYHQVQRLGIEVVCNKRAVEYFESKDKGGVVTADGKRTEADLVIASDGIGSKAQTLILGEQVPGRYSGHSVLRTAYPLETAFQDPVVKANFYLIDGRPTFRAFWGPETHAMVLSSKDTIAWGIDHKGAEGGPESWHKAISNDDVLRIMDQTPGWGTLVRALVKTAPPGAVVDYPIVFRNPQPQWASPYGRVMTLGDSAHTFIPTSGVGATSAIEDALSIASCLQLGGKQNIPTAIRAHNKLRFERVANAQRLGFINKQRFQFTDWETAKKDPRRLNPMVPQWIFTHDAEKYVYDNYGKVVASLTEDELPFENTNVPPGSKFKLWAMDELLDEMKRGIPLQMDGDWS